MSSRIMPLKLRISPPLPLALHIVENAGYRPMEMPVIYPHELAQPPLVVSQAPEAEEALTIHTALR